MRYLARICYDGSHFMGFQRLNDGTGVQNELERVLSIINGKKVLVKGAGRTDRGVHALDQCIHFDLEIDIDKEKLKYVMNRMLSPYISITSVEEVVPDFHARFLVKEKTYIYKVYVGEKNPFYQDYAYMAYQHFDLKVMKRCARLFVGSHDYRNFVSGERENYQSIISSFRVVKKENFILFTVKGQGFYRYMVRSIVGAILDVGSSKHSITEVKEALENPSLLKTFFVAPAEGLYLVKIKY